MNAPSTLASRPVSRIFPAPGLHWVGDGFRVQGFLGAYLGLREAMNPFLMLDYHPAYTYPPTETPRGVGVHPHRGFQTVTLAFEGSVSHHDSAGGGGTIGPGDVQWMSAARGVLHKEYHEAEFSRKGGVFHMAQLWVNLPAAHKMDAPTYHAITASEIPTVTTEAGAAVRVVSGEFGATTGPARPYTPVLLLDARVPAGGALAIPAPGSHALGMVVMEGALAFEDGRTAETGTFVLFEKAEGAGRFTATSDARVLVMGGEPIDEPVVAYGPFVMNTEAEIVQAIQDLNAGAFGELED